MESTGPFEPLDYISNLQGRMPGSGVWIREQLPNPKRSRLPSEIRQDSGIETSWHEVCRLARFGDLANVPQPFFAQSELQNEPEQSSNEAWTRKLKASFFVVGFHLSDVYGDFSIAMSGFFTWLRFCKAPGRGFMNFDSPTTMSAKLHLSFSFKYVFHFLHLFLPYPHATVEAAKVSASRGSRRWQ